MNCSQFICSKLKCPANVGLSAGLLGLGLIVYIVAMAQSKFKIRYPSFLTNNTFFNNNMVNITNLLFVALPSLALVVSLLLCGDSRISKGTTMTLVVVSSLPMVLVTIYSIVATFTNISF